MKTPQKPIKQLGTILNLNNEVWLKFENKHHYGSHKGRSIPVMMDEYIKKGQNSFVISSSGNAALAALRYVTAHNKNKPGQPLKLKIFVGNSIEPKKLEKLKNEMNECIELSRVDKPKQESIKYSKETGAVILRASLDPLALTGYETLADELSRIPNLGAVFLATSSGTAAEGIFLGFKKLGINPEIHIVQTEYCHPIANYFYERNHIRQIPTSGQRSNADAIVDKVGRRKESIYEALSESNGYAWVASETEIKDSVSICRSECDEEITANGCLALAGLKKAILNGRHLEGNIACIVGGD